MQSLEPIEQSASRIETLMAATLYLMSQQRCAQCPELALCVARHLQCMARHPDAKPVIRNVCLSLYESWARAGGLTVEPGTLQ